MCQENLQRKFPRSILVRCHNHSNWFLSMWSISGWKLTLDTYICNLITSVSIQHSWQVMGNLWLVIWVEFSTTTVWYIISIAAKATQTNLLISTSISFSQVVNHGRGHWHSRSNTAGQNGLMAIQGILHSFRVVVVHLNTNYHTCPQHIIKQKKVVAMSLADWTDNLEKHFGGTLIESHLLAFYDFMSAMFSK